jgi:hypothetical protein
MNEPPSRAAPTATSLDLDEVRAAWRRATDADVSMAAFENATSYPPRVRAIIYAEFTSRGLPAPPDEPPRSTGQARADRRAMTFKGFAVYLITFVGWSIVLAVAWTASRSNFSSVGVVCWLLILIAVPGLATCSYMAQLQARFHPDPEGHTRCGSCGHILRGLTTPRCPECGTAL